MQGNLANQLELWGFEDEFTVFSDGSLGFALECAPIDISCWDEERINAFSQSTRQFLNGLPEDLSIQFIQDIAGGNGALLDKHRASKEGLAKWLTDERYERFQSLDESGLIPIHSLKVVVRQKATGPLLKKPTLFYKTSLFQPIAEQKLEAEITRLSQLRDSVFQGLEAIGIRGQSIPISAVLDLVYSQWNPSRGIPLGTYDPEDVRTGLLFTDVALDSRGFSLADWQYRVVSLKILPEDTFASMAVKLRELPFDSRLFLSVAVPDQRKEIGSLQMQRRLAFSMARGKKTGVSDLESESKFQDIEDLLEKMIAEGEKVFQVSLNVLLRSKDASELDAQVSQTLMKFRELSGAEAMEEGLAAFDIFKEMALPNGQAKERAKRMKTTNLAHFLPVFGPWPGHKTPTVLFRSRMGSLVSFDPFSSDLTNYNHIISGGSGSGKSFFTNLFLLQMLKEDPRIFIVDIGGSYRKLCDNLGGQNVALGTDINMSINPFDLPQGESVPSNQKIKFLVGLVELLTREEDETRLPRFERAVIEEAIQQVYAKSPSPLLSDLRKILEQNESAEIRRLGRILSPWCGETPFGRFLDRPTSIRIESPIVAFDLKGLDSYPDLQAVCLFIITDLVWREVQKDRVRKKFLIFDECWKLLESDAGSQFIGEVFRTFRKYFAGVIAISQNIDDFAKSKISTAILSNSSLKWILMQKGADQKRLKEVLQLNDAEVSLIASLHQERGLYSEVFLIAEQNRSVILAEPTPLEYWIATTDPRDLAEIEKEEKENPDQSKIEILRVLASKFPRGKVAT